MRKGTLGTEMLEFGAFAGPAAPLLLLFALHKMPLPLPASSPRLTQLVPIPGSASAPAPVPRPRWVLRAASAPPASPLHQTAPLASPC